MYPECGGEEEYPRPIRRWAEKRDKLFSPCVLSSKEEVDMDEAISHSPGKKQGELLNIVRDSEVVKP